MCTMVDAMQYVPATHATWFIVKSVKILDEAKNNVASGTRDAHQIHYDGRVSRDHKRVAMICASMI